MLWSPQRHEPLRAASWDEGLARATIARIVRLAEEESAGGLWRTHPRDPQGGPWRMLYAGACGTIWALHYLAARGAAVLARDYTSQVAGLLVPNRADFGEHALPHFGSYLMGDTSIRMLHLASHPGEGLDEIAALIEANMDHPAREFMWGAPGTLAAALFMHRHTGQERFATLFRATAGRLAAQLQWSEAEQCSYWTQQLPGGPCDFIDAVHGFVGTAAPLIQGRHLLPAEEWEAWRNAIATTVRRTAEWDGACANWRARLGEARGQPLRMQYCHGAPGFVVCLGDWPDDTLDDLLAAGAEAVWQAGPHARGPQLCHGTGGNGYAFLKMWRRTRDPKWLERARAFAMHGIGQFEQELGVHGRLWPTLWTGHPGFAIYLLDCIEGTDRFPTVDVFFTPTGSG